ncbi:hypothetical protein GP486_001058 [Trichoglossum hirsutum]|uniref:DUF7779 domain-containing protein n=1 Tax=Trichoglossum hirsutum TaxID=265104 RepID=A0A9P8RSZ3_9PEZI|nr:hypothetical protein GP486_001058 [Trichoglossum hirsutum]
MLELKAGGGSTTGLNIFDVPGLLSPCFTGRELLLGQLHAILKAPTQAERNEQDCISYRRAAIYGLPGSGKTQLALKYASHYREQYSAVFFVSAARISTLTDGYERIVSLLNLPERSRTDSRIKVAAARAWLENSTSDDGRNWLLIVDNINPDAVRDDNGNSDDMNATVIDLVRDFLPREGTRPQGSIMLTTRKPRAAEIVVGDDANLCIGVGKMDEEEAVNLLRRVSGKSEDADCVHRIAKELGYLPLAINQAATYIKVEEVELEQFLENFRREKDEMLDWREDDNPQQDSSTTNIYRMAFKGLVKKSPVSADLFRLFSFLDPERIPVDLLTDGSRGVPQSIELCEVIKSPIRLSKALADMRSGSLAQRFGDSKEKNYWIHDLVQYLSRQWLEPDERREWAERAIDIVTFAYPDTLGSFETWEKANKYLKHGLACTEHAEVLEIQTVNLGNLLIRMSWFLRQTGDLAAAKRLAVRAVGCAKVFGEGQHQHMNSLSNLGLIYYHLSLFRDAKEQWTDALEMGKKLLGPSYVDTGIGNNLALLCYQEARFKEAERYHLEIYLRRKDTLGENHAETLGAMGSLANTYHFQGRLEEAVDLKIRILEGRKRYMGEHHPETLGAKGSLATTYSDQGLLEKAEKLQQEVMVGRKDQWGEQNPEYLSAKGALSYTFYLQGRFDEAEIYQRVVLAERVKLWGKQNVETLGAMRHLAKTWYHQGRLSEAAELQEEVVFGMSKLLGEDHPETLTSVEELSTTYRDQGFFEGVEDLRERVTKERERLWGKEHAETLRSMEALSRKHQGFAH